MRMRVALGLVLVLVAACTTEVPDSDTTAPVAAVQQALMGEFHAPGDTVDVIINFREPPERLERGARRELYQRLQQQLMAAHHEGFSARRQFIHVPAMAARISRDALAKLQQDPFVAYIQLDGRGSGQLKEAVPAIGGDLVKSMYNLTGKGVRVAVLDTGVVTKHPDLMDSIVGQHCFTQGDCPPGRTNEGTSAEDDHGHGSNVAGIISSNGVVAPIGFAPNAELVSVKINDADDSGQISDWVAGFDWLYDNLATLKIKVVNASICTTALYADAAACDKGEPALAMAVKNLIDAGVTVFAASGNLGSSTQLSAPACNTGVVAVAATYDSNVGTQPTSGLTYAAQYGASVADCGDRTTEFDQITCFSNTPARVELVAPGAPMTSDGLNNKTETYRGTSQASPVAAAVAALMLECNPALTPLQIKQAMISSGVPKMDPKNGRMIPSLRAVAAVQAACFNGVNGPAAGAGAAAGGGAPTGSGVGGFGAAGAAGGTLGGLPSSAGASANNGVTSGSIPTQDVSAGRTGTLQNGVTAAGTGAGTAAANGGAPAGTYPPASQPPAANGGCGCSVPGAGSASSGTDTRTASLAAALFLGLAFQRSRTRARRR
jgi:Subtilase family